MRLYVFPLFSIYYDGKTNTNHASDLQKHPLKSLKTF
jgi:hypothetical protein